MVEGTSMVTLSESPQSNSREDDDEALADFTQASPSSPRKLQSPWLRLVRPMAAAAARVTTEMPMAETAMKLNLFMACSLRARWRNRTDGNAGGRNGWSAWPASR